MRAKLLKKIALNTQVLVSQFGPKLLARYNQEHNAKLTEAMPLIQEIISKDTSSKQHTYIPWLVGNYARGGRREDIGINRWEDIFARAIPDLVKYDKLKNLGKLPVEDREINRIKGLSSLEDLVEKYPDEEAVSKNQETTQKEQDFYKNGQAELVYNDSQVKVVVPKTVEASQFFGVNTRWCTAAKSNNMFQRFD